MLLNDLYSIKEIQQLDDSITELAVSINGEHPIFGGHFPGQPVMPGVCQLQMTTDLAAHILKRDLKLFESSMMKFLAVLDPRVCKEVKVKIEIKEDTPEKVRLNSQIVADDSVFFKFRGVFK